ncbi:MAG: alpha/beta hydrolase [Jatrophihabitans sp.]
MTLLGAPLLVLLGVLTVAAPVLAFVLWSRLPGPLAVRGLIRLAMVVTSQIVAVCLVAAAVNDYEYFYKSWSELAGGAAQFAGSPPATGAPRTAPNDRQHGRLGRGGRISARTDTSFSTAAQWTSRGRLESVQIEGELSRLKSHAFVYLPPQYFQPAYRHTLFPALEVFTGYPGIDQYLIARLRYQDVLLDLIRRQAARPMVLIMMRPSVTFPLDSECTDVPAGPQAFTFFADDVPTQVASNYRVLPTGWGTIGDSTGAYCATKLAMLHPEVFNAAAEMSGYFFALKDRTTGDLWGGSRVIRDLNDLKWRLAHLPAPPVSILVGTSKSEKGPDGYAEARRFVRLVKAPMTADMMTVPHGGHNTATWTAEIPAALTWLSERIAPAGASASGLPQTDLGEAAT